MLLKICYLDPSHVYWLTRDYTGYTIFDCPRCRVSVEDYLQDNQQFEDMQEVMNKGEVYVKDSYWP